MGDAWVRRLIGAIGLAVAMVLGLLAPAASVGAAPPTGGISGVVTSDVGGAPLGGVTVTAYNSETFDTYDATTAPDGTYTISALPMASYYVEFTMSGYATEYWNDVTFLYDGDFVNVGNTVVGGISAGLAPVSTISGTVTDPMGDPVEFAWVSASGPDYDSTYTAADGTYTIEIAAGSYQVSFQPPFGSGWLDEYYDNAYTTMDATPVVVGPGAGVTGIDAQFDQGATISGTVTDELDVALAYAGLYVESVPAGFDGYTSADGDGNYEFVVPPGSYIVSAEASGYPQMFFDGVYDKGAATPVTTNGVPATGIDFQLQPGGNLSGTVTGPGGVPLEDIDVSVFPVGSNEPIMGANSDASGDWSTWESVPPGDYEVRFSDTYGSYAGEWYDDSFGRGGATQIPVAGGADVTGIDGELALVSSVAGELEGTVTGPGGPVGFTEVTLFDPYDPYSYGEHYGYAASDGTYSITGVAPGDWQVLADPPAPLAPQFFSGAYTEAEADLVAVPANGTGTANFTLVTGGTISGTVTDPLGDPVEGAYVYSYGGLGGYFGSSATTQADGTYTVTGLAPGDHAICFQPPSDSILLEECYDDVRGGMDPTLVPVTLGANTPDIDAELGEGGAIAGTVLDGGGDPVVGAYVYADATCFGCARPRATYASGMTEADGTYELLGLDPGEYQVSVDPPDGELLLGETYPSDVAVTAPDTTGGVDFELGPSGGISGTVSRPGGDPLADVFVAACGDDFCDIGGRGWTDNDGSYVIGGLPEGNYRVVFNAPYDSIYLDECYDDNADCASPTPVATTIGSFTENIDAELAVDSAYGLPGAPIGVGGVPGNQEATVNWTAPADTGGLDITEYEVTASPGGATCSTGGATSCVVTGLTNGTAYTFTVRATNEVGTGPASTPSAPVTPVGPPGAPTGATATAGDEEATVSWTAPASTGGSPITLYNVTSSPAGGACSSPAATTCVVTGLDNGTSYTFTVTASNAAGAGPASAPSNAVTPAGPPDAPTGVIGAAGNQSVQVSWTAPADDGGSPITGYEVTANPGGATCSTGGATSCTVPGLTNGTPYTFTVVATNAKGDSPPSAPSASVTPAAVPGPPTGVSGVAGNAQVTVSWTAPADNGGSPITGYEVTANPGGATCSTGGATSCTVPGLTNGTAYTFTVVATNANGDGPPSAASAPVTPEAPVTSDCGPAPAPGPFPDVAGTHVFCTDIEWLADSGVTGGFSDGTFRPSSDITRGSMAAFLYRYAGSPAFTAPGTPTFSDVPTSHVFYKEIEWAVAEEITGGFSDGTFRPGASITRGSMAAFFYRMAGEPAFTAPGTPTFPDVAASHPFYKEIEWLVSVEVTGGFSDGTYRPANPVTRGNFAAFLHRFDGLEL